ncbi:SDR family NAD(P)-dependent oxidoreductase [Lacrimispora sp.]|uniref:SDR family NAD(P)-dependent oxidoreductase n=1 Tax=Lacrimispora sp. TaxID=2719234 RepID=UPI0028966082|nr:glucose 1-dehydrogenase [Lacrimispora sp.]
MGFNGEVVIVTGASSGVGRAAAVLFADKGAVVVAIGRKQKELELLKLEIEEKGHQCLVAVMDVSDERAWEEVTSSVMKKTGRIDVLVNNAGVTSREKVAEGSRELWDSIMNINAYGPYLGMKYCIPYMQERKKGSIVNVTSVGGVVGIGGGTVYPASKGALYSMSRRVAVNYGEDNIRVNTVCPGWIETPMTDGARPEKAMQFMDRQALNYYGTPEDVANAILFLASDEARFITGAELRVDGGFTAG